MDKLIRTDLAVSAERALLVCVESPNSQVDPYDPLGELRSLAMTAGAVVVDEMLAKRRRIDPAYYVGSGKAGEIATRVQAAEADVVIFDNDLSPAQIRDLEGAIGCKVLDRSELILDIFASRARTHEACLQVELAQLEYTYPRLRQMWTHLERIAGGAAAMDGIGTRGPGEKQIEIDRRLVQKRVIELKRSLLRIDRRKVRTTNAIERAFREVRRRTRPMSCFPLTASSMSLTDLGWPTRIGTKFSGKTTSPRRGRIGSVSRSRRSSSFSAGSSRIWSSGRAGGPPS